jgi:hypothetical protein
MIGRHIFSLTFCAFLLFGHSAGASPRTDSIELDSLAIDESLPSIAADPKEKNLNSTLRRDPKSSNHSELFAKVLELEDQIRKLNGDLQRSDHERENLALKVDGLYNQATTTTKTASNQFSEKKHKTSYLTTIVQASNLINNGENVEAIKLLDLYIQKANTQKKSLGDEGELYYWLAKAYANEKRLDKAAHYFAKSYKYNVDVRSKNILVSLIETLALDGQYKQICPLLSKLDMQYLASLNATKRNAINALKKSHCLKN